MRKKQPRCRLCRKRPQHPALYSCLPCFRKKEAEFLKSRPRLFQVRVDWPNNAHEFYYVFASSAEEARREIVRRMAVGEKA